MKSKKELQKMEPGELVDYLNTLTLDEWSVIVMNAKTQGYDISEVLSLVKKEGNRFDIHWYAQLYFKLREYFGIEVISSPWCVDDNSYPEELRDATLEEILEYKRKKE